MLDPRWLQSIYCALGDPRINEEADVEVVIQRAREKYSEARPRIISDNGPQFIAKDFKDCIRIAGMKHVRTSPYYPQSNGKIERWHHTLKSECIRPGVLLSLEDARTVVERYIARYNSVRLNSRWLCSLVKLEGREKQLFEEREKKLETDREKRRDRRRQVKLADRSEENCLLVNLN